MPYFNSYYDKDNNLTFSVDMIKICGLIKHGHKDIIAEYLSKRGELLGWAQPYLSTRPLRAHYMLHMTYDDNSSIQLMIGMNTFKGTISDDMIIIYNPNKVLDKSYNHLWIDAMKDLYFLLDNIKSTEIKSLDLAIDIPVKRQDVTVLPAWGRQYSRYNGDSVIGVEDGVTIVNAEDYTQYVGHHNNHGFVKVYNKRIEANLDFDTTRVEYTIFPSEHKSNYRYTPVYYLPSHQMTLPAAYDNELYHNFMLLAARLQVSSEVVQMFESRKIKTNIKTMVLHDFVNLDFAHNTTFKSLWENINSFCDKNTYKITDNYTYRDADEYYLLYSRRKYLKKFKYQGENGKWYYAVDISYDEMIKYSDDEFNDAVKFFCDLHNIDTTDIVPYEFKSKAKAEKVEKEYNTIGYALGEFYDNPFINTGFHTREAFIEELTALIWLYGEKYALDIMLQEKTDIEIIYDNSANIIEQTWEFYTTGVLVAKNKNI